MKALTLILLSVVAFSGCYKAKIQLTSPKVSVVSTSVDDKMHFSLIDFIELSNAIDINGACPNEAVAIQERVSILGGFVNSVIGLYAPIFSLMNASVMCASE